jgi:hypothetical protein
MLLKYFVVATMVFLAFASWGCGKKTEKDILLETIDKIGDYAEDRDLDPILDYISDSYSDDEDRTAEDIGDLLAENIEKYRGIVVNILSTKINGCIPPDASVETEVAFSSGAAQIFRKAVRYAGEFYRFKVDFIKEEKKWKVKRASWEYVPLEELFPESVKVLKTLFPDI